MILLLFGNSSLLSLQDQLGLAEPTQVGVITKAITKQEIYDNIMVILYIVISTQSDKVVN